MSGLLIKNDPEYCQYWWNLYAFDVYCAVRDGNKTKYEEAISNLAKFETHIRKEYPTLIKRLKRSVDWS